MATYHVGIVGSTGLVGSNSRSKAEAEDPRYPWLTFAYAASQSAAGDTIKIMPGTYNRSADVIVITKSNQTWTAYDEDDMPIIDGGYGPSLIRDNGELPHPRKVTGCRPDVGTIGYIGAGLVSIESGVTDTTISYLKIYNSRGAAIDTKPNNHRTTVDNCIIDFTYAGAIGASGNGTVILEDFKLTNCVITRSSMRKMAEGKSRYCECHKPNGTVCAANSHDINPATGEPYRNCGGLDSVDVTVKPKTSVDAVIKGNTIAFTYGEGIAAAAGSNDITIEDNIIHNTYHWALGLNCSKGAIVRRNRIFTTGDLPLISTASAGIVIGDEQDLFNSTKQNSVDAQIYNNLVIGYKECFNIRGFGAKRYATVLDNVYVGYNTFIGIPYVNADVGTRTVMELQNGAKIVKSGTQDVQVETNHGDVLFENNVIVRNGAQQLLRVPGNMGNTGFRNNAFNDTMAKVNSAAALAGGSNRGNVYETDHRKLVVNQSGSRAAAYDVKMSNSACTALAKATAFNVANYYLPAASTVIGEGAPHTALAGVDVTPAVGGSTGQDNTDGLGNTRSDLGGGKFYDIGWYEMGGTTSGVTPSFTQTDPATGNPITGGPIGSGVTVRFTDTSTTSGGVTIQERLWKFDGSSSDDPVASSGTTIDYTYSQPGTYQPVLSLRSSENGGTLWYLKAGTAMTFTGGNQDGVYIDTVSVDIGTSTGTKSFTFNLGDNVPKLVVFTMTAATSTSAVADGALLSHGFASSVGGVSQYGVSMFSKDNSATTSTGRLQSNSRCLLAISEGGTITGSAYVAANGFTKNTVTLTIDDAFPANYLVTATAYGGSGIRAKVGTGLGPAAAQEQVNVPVGFEPSLFCLVTNNRTWTADTTAAASFGYATAVDNQFYFRWHEGDARDTAFPEVNAGAGIAYRNQSSNQFVLKVASFGPTGVTLSCDDGPYNVNFGWYAIETDLGIDMRLLQVAVPTPTTGSNQDVTLGWQPGHMQSITTNLSMAASPKTWRVNDTTAAASHIGFHVNRDADGSIPAFERTNLPGIRHGDSAGVTHTTSRILNNVMGVRRSYTRNNVDDIDTELEAATSFLSTGYRLAWTTKTVSDKAWLIIAMQTGVASTPTGPTVSFRVTDAAGNAPAVGLEPFTAYLTDTSDDNGATITQWNIDWGDGVVQGVTTRPSALAHEYEEAGTYAVSVTATNSNGSETRTQNGAVIVTSVPGDQIIGPLRPGTITEDTQNEVVLDIESNLRGFITHKLELGALKISNDYPAFTVDSGHWQIAVVDNKLKVMGSNGAIGEINITWDDTSPPPPPPSSGSVNAQVRTGNDDGDEAVPSSPGNGIIDLVDASLIRINQAGHWAALRFANTSGTAIPKGANIATAKLSLYLNSADNDSPNVTIYAHDTANAGVLGTDAYSISTLTKTTASVNWTGSNLALGWQDSPSLVSVIQEIVTDYGWPANEHITLILDAETGCALTWRPYEYDAQLAAKLTVTYTT